jgi:DNA-binding LacI/PurR family transcriptional regulator
VSRQPTIIDVADAAGVSKATVSRVLRGEDRVSPAAQEAVHKAVREVGYTPNFVARSLKERVSSVVGFVAGDLSNPYYADILHGVYQAAGSVGHQVIIASGHEAAGGEEGAIKALMEFRVAGVILASPSISMKSIARLTNGLPVAIEGHADAPPRFDVVTSDDREGGWLVIDHLVTLGHERFAILEDAGPAGHDRKLGFQNAVTRARITSKVRRVATHPSAEGGYESMRQVLKRGLPPTAVACDNDVVASGAMSALDEAGLSVPDDVSVTGFDDIALARLRQFDLTTIRQDRWAIGRICFDVVHRRAQHPEGNSPGRVILRPTLKVRGSTGPAPKC